MQSLEDREQAEVILLVIVVADWFQEMYLHGQTPRSTDGHHFGGRGGGRLWQYQRFLDLCIPTIVT